MKKKRIDDGLCWARQVLAQVTDTSQLDSEILLSYVLQLTRTQLISRNRQILTSAQWYGFTRLVLQRKAGVPVAYLTGQQEFWSLPLEVTVDTLIPRPETELLVELALKKFSPEQPLRIVDLGTGSGAIALAIAHERPNWRIVATDCFSSTLEVARRNARRLGITNVEFRLGNWCTALVEGERYHAIISNPPYVQANPYWRDALKFEPAAALFSDQDGLSDLVSIMTQARTFLVDDGLLLLEHGYDQANSVKRLLFEYHYFDVTQHKDLRDIFRVTTGKNF